MRRVVLVSLLFPALAAAQGFDDWIESAVDARTPPDQRQEALKKIAQSKDALDRLAEKGLDAARDPEVVHAVVDTLLKGDYKPYLERMLRLVAAKAHRDKVLRRLQGVWEADRGAPLLDACITTARESPEPDLKRAAILVLGKIPRRRAAEAIVDAGLATADENVRAEARAYVQRWFGVLTLRDAALFLQARKLDSFQDLVESRVDSLIAKEREDEERTRRFLEKASLAEALEEMERGGAFRHYAAQRLLKLAEENGIKDKGEFARRVFNAVVAELSSGAPDPRVLASLLGALQRFATDPPSGPLWQTTKPKDVLETLQGVADLPGSGADHREMGSAAVRLLGVIDGEGIALHAFAERFPSVEVRKEAIQQLGELAHRVPEQKNYVGIKLASLLVGAEKQPAIRAQILNLLTQPHVPVASAPVDVVKVVCGYLEKAVSPEPTDAELRDCIHILGKRQTPEGKVALLKAASSHEKLQVRRYALEEALVPWAKTEETILDDLKALALNGDQSADARRAVVEALGKKGDRRAEATLTAIEREGQTDDPDLAGAIRDARLQLLKRLANGESAADAPEQRALDLEAAGRILEQEADADPERMEPLAAQLVKAADAAKIPAGSARYRLAWFSAHLPEGKRKDADVLQRYEDAANNAVADVLPAPARETMLEEYRELLLKAPDEDRLARAVSCSSDLARLAMDAKDKTKAARCYLDAVETAIRLKSRELAKDMLDRAKATGGVGAELAAREQELRGKVEQLS